MSASVLLPYSSINVNILLNWRYIHTAFFAKKLVVCFDSVSVLCIQSHLFLDQHIPRLYPPTVPKMKINKPPCTLNHINWLIQ